MNYVFEQKEDEEASDDEDDEEVEEKDESFYSDSDYAKEYDFGYLGHNDEKNDVDFR